MIHYVYKITHTNGKFYIGRHSTTNIDDGYTGSGKWVRSIKNKSTLSKEIISYSENFEKLLESEKVFINLYLDNPLCMNFNNNPIGFASGKLNPAKTEKEKIRKSKYKGPNNSMFGKKHTEEAREKMSVSRKGKTTWNKGKKGVKTSNKGQVAWNKGKKTGYKSFTGKKHSEDSIQKMRAKHAERPKLQCCHCGKIIDKPNYTRYHGDKCKFIQD
jgi:hypothetical protein